MTDCDRDEMQALLDQFRQAMAREDKASPFDQDAKQRIGEMWVARHVDDGLVPARVIEAVGDETAHARGSHVGEIHRPASFVLTGGHGQQRVT
jgi:hypothetical protein